MLTVTTAVFNRLITCLPRVLRFFTHRAGSGLPPTFRAVGRKGLGGGPSRNRSVDYNSGMPPETEGSAIAHAPATAR
jgi:hypothetical protein